MPTPRRITEFGHFLLCSLAEANPEVAAPITLGDLRLPSGNPSGGPKSSRREHPFWRALFGRRCRPRAPLQQHT